MGAILTYFQQGWHWIKAKGRYLENRVWNYFNPKPKSLAGYFSPTHTWLYKQKDMTLFLIYATLALEHNDIEEANWATTRILGYVRAPLLSDWPVSSKLNQHVQDIYYHRLCLKWGDYYHQQGDLQRAITWYNLITPRHTDYYIKALHQLASIALNFAEPDNTTDDYYLRAVAYLKDAALLGDKDAQTALFELNVDLEDLPAKKPSNTVYAQLEIAIQAYAPVFKGDFNRGNNSMYPNSRTTQSNRNANSTTTSRRLVRQTTESSQTSRNRSSSQNVDQELRQRRTTSANSTIKRGRTVQTTESLQASRNPWSIENPIQESRQQRNASAGFTTRERLQAGEILQNSPIEVEDIDGEMQAEQANPIINAHFKFKRKAKESLQNSLNDVDTIFSEAISEEKHRKSPFASMLNKVLKDYEEHINSRRFNGQENGREELYHEIINYIYTLKHGIREAVLRKNDAPLLLLLKEKNTVGKNFGCHPLFLGFYRDIFDIKPFKQRLKQIEKEAMACPSLLYKRSDRRREIKLEDMKKGTKELVENNYDEMEEHYKDSEEMVVTYVHQLTYNHEEERRAREQRYEEERRVREQRLEEERRAREQKYEEERRAFEQKMSAYDQRISEFESGQLYIQLKALPDKLEQDKTNLQSMLENQESNYKSMLENQESNYKSMLENQRCQFTQKFEGMERQVSIIENNLKSYKRYDQETESMLCPIGSDIMQDPVIAEDGHTYERENILKWLERSDTSPLTRQPMGLTLTPNYALKGVINEYLEKKQKVQDGVAQANNLHRLFNQQRNVQQPVNDARMQQNSIIVQRIR